MKRKIRKIENELYFFENGEKKIGKNRDKIGRAHV